MIQTSMNLLTPNPAQITSFVLICVAASTVISSCLTWFIAVLVHKRGDCKKSAFNELMKHAHSEPNAYEDVEKFRPLNDHSIYAKTSSLKKNTSFRAKLETLDDINYN